MISKLYARFWLWKKGYCKHGVKWQITPVVMWCLKTLPCHDCASERNHRADIREQRQDQKKQRMLDLL